MSKLTESAIEDFAIKLFERLGYSYSHAPDIAPDSDNPERSRYDEVVLSQRLANAVKRINPDVPTHALQEALKEVGRIHSPELLAKNEAFHRLLTEGVKVSYQQNGNERGDLVAIFAHESFSAVAHGEEIPQLDVRFTAIRCDRGSGRTE